MFSLGVRFSVLNSGGWDDIVIMLPPVGTSTLAWARANPLFLGCDCSSSVTGTHLYINIDVSFTETHFFSLNKNNSLRCYK